MNFERFDHTFVSDGLECAGWLYLPTAKEKPPVIVMAHGFGAERTFGIPPFAEKFAAAGIACFVFDYRNFGDSQGQPRNLISWPRHLADWHAALAYVRSLDEVDSDRLGLWGSSYSGGHVLVIGARDKGVRAVISQVPFVSGPASAAKISAGNMIRLTAAAVADVVKSAAGLGPHKVTIVDEPGNTAMLNTPDARQLYQRLVPPDSDWQNECPARVALTTLFYMPIASANRIDCPVLMIAAKNDSLIPLSAVKRTASRIKDVVLNEYDCGHFDVYFDDLFVVVSDAERDFLIDKLTK